MFGHMKIIGLSVGLLVILSGLSSVSFAVARHRTVTETATPALVAAVSPQAAQASVATAASLRSIGIGY